MLTMVQNAILHVTNYGFGLPEPTSLLLVGTLMLTIGNLQRRAAGLANEARESLRSGSNV